MKVEETLVVEPSDFDAFFHAQYRSVAGWRTCSAATLAERVTITITVPSSLLPRRPGTPNQASNAVPIPPEIRRTKRWVKARPRNSGSAISSLNPFDPLAQLRGQHVKLKDLGMTRLGGQAVHQYQGTQRIRYTPPSTSGPTVTLTAAFDMYVDSHDRLVRLTSITKQPGMADGAKTQVNVSDYGVHVNVTAPPADQVYTPPDTPPHT